MHMYDDTEKETIGIMCASGVSLHSEQDRYFADNSLNFKGDASS